MANSNEPRETRDNWYYNRYFDESVFLSKSPPAQGYEYWNEVRRQLATRDLEDIFEDHLIGRITDRLIYQAFDDEVTRIHFERTDTSVRLRYLKAGLLQEVKHLPKHMHGSVISHLRGRGPMKFVQCGVAQYGLDSVLYDATRISTLVEIVGNRGDEAVILHIVHFWPHLQWEVRPRITGVRYQQIFEAINVRLSEIEPGPPEEAAARAVIASLPKLQHAYNQGDDPTEALQSFNHAIKEAVAAYTGLPVATLMATYEANRSCC